MSIRAKFKAQTVEAPEHKPSAGFFDGPAGAANTEAQAPEASPTVHTDSSVNTVGAAQPQVAEPKEPASFLSVTAGQGAHSADPLARFGPMIPLSTHRPSVPSADQIKERAKRKEEQERRAFAGMAWAQR